MSVSPHKAGAPTRVLLADDNASDRLILRAILEREGYQVTAVSDGSAAVAAYARERPQLVLMDAMMPRLDGREAARRIKVLAGDELVPVVFLTSLSEASELASCLEAGGDDFLTKPCNPVVLRAKLAAYERMRNLHELVIEQRNQIAQANAHLLQEQTFAKAVFDNVAHSGCLDAPFIKHLVSPLAVFNGDVLLAARNASGGVHLLVGDFTGHGLPAAIGAMPLADIFYRMSAKGFSAGHIVREMNQRLKAFLPTGVFCCASMVEVNWQRGEFSVWHGGLPDAYLLRRDSPLEVISSSHLPLGVVGDDRFDAGMTRYRARPGDRLLLYTDGIVEAENEVGDCFGNGRLRSALADGPAEHCFERLLAAFEAFATDARRRDDLTVVEVAMFDEAYVDDAGPEEDEAAMHGPADWRLTYELGADSLKHFDPLPLLQSIVSSVPGLRRRSGELLTVLTEMYSNAIDHGVLRLDSQLKARGFEAYFAERARRLARLDEAFVRFALDHQPVEGGGVLRIRVSDSGPGFEASRCHHHLYGDQRAYGRGLEIIRRLCRRVEFTGNGNTIEAEFEWRMTG